MKDVDAGGGVVSEGEVRAKVEKGREVVGGILV